MSGWGSFPNLSQTWGSFTIILKRKIILPGSRYEMGKHFNDTSSTTFPTRKSLSII